MAERFRSLNVMWNILLVGAVGLLFVVSWLLINSL